MSEQLERSVRADEADHFDALLGREPVGSSVARRERPVHATCPHLVRARPAVCGVAVVLVVELDEGGVLASQVGEIAEDRRGEERLVPRVVEVLNDSVAPGALEGR